MAAQNLASSFKNQIQGNNAQQKPTKAQSPQGPKGVFKNITETAKSVAETASDQIAGGDELDLGLESSGEPQFDEAAYREKVKRDEEEKMKQLRARLAQLNSEMQQASNERQRSQQEYVENQTKLMQQQDRGGLSEEEYAQKQQEEFVPDAVKARQGTGESGKRNRKG